MVLGGAGLLVGTVLCLGLAADPDGGKALSYIAPPFLMIGVVYLAPAFVGGIGLLRGARWAPLVIGALSAFLLLVIPLGTALGAFGFWAMARAARPTPAPAVAPTAAPAPVAPAPVTFVGPQPEPLGRRALGILTAMAMVGSGFIVVLGAGFRLHHETPPGYLGSGFYPAIVVFVGVIAYVVVKRPFAADGPRPRALNPFEQRRLRAKWRAERKAFEAERRERIARLSADPELRGYAEQIAAGEAWSDGQIAYDRDPGALAACVHLQPVEAAMRRAHLDLRLVAPLWLSAPCRIDEAALRAQFDLPASVTYVEAYLGGRAAEDDPVGYILCRACQSQIGTVHPREARSQTSVFPDAG